MKARLARIPWLLLVTLVTDLPPPCAQAQDNLRAGTVIGWGQSTVPAGLNNVVAIAAGGDHSLALKRNGTVVAWGWNGGGQSTVPAGLNNVVAIAAGRNHSLALKGDGTVVAWGWNVEGQSTVPAGL